MRVVLPLLTLLLLSSCVQYARPGGEDESFLRQPVYFATNRALAGGDNLNRYFTGDRGELHFGISSVAIPADYPRAQTVGFAHWNIEKRRNPDKSLTLLAIQPLDRLQFQQQLQTLQHTDEPQLLLIHGYNISFEKASRLAAKLAYDLDLKTPPLLFSWPSEANLRDYAVDLGNIDWAQADFNQLLLQQLETSADNSLILVAHSLGNRALLHALITLLPEHPELSARIRGVVLAAPDIDQALFVRDIAPALYPLALPITLYVSEKDLALAASARMHGYPRLGQTVTLVPGITTIDATAADAEWLLGHEYVSQGAQTILDIYQWLILQRPPAQRSALIERQLENRTYWQIQVPRAHSTVESAQSEN